MAVKTFYVLATSGITPNFYGNLQDSGSAPSGANTAFGWTPSSTAVAFWRARLGAVATDTTSKSSSYIDSPTAGPIAGTGTTNTNAGDSFITPVAYTGTFANTAWTFNWIVRATTVGSIGRVRMRVWASVNADGSSPRELTTSTQVGATITLSALTTDYNSSMSWSPGVVTLNNEFLFFQIEWNRTTTGPVSANVLFRQGTALITTPDFELMAVDAVATTFVSSGVSSFTDTSLTISATSNLVLILFFAIDTNVTSLTASWDSTGTPQAMTHIGVKAASDNSLYCHLFGLIAPHTGNKTLSVSWTGTAGYMGTMASFTGADQTAPATTFKNVATDASTPGSAGNYPSGGMVITTISGDMAVMAAGTFNGLFNAGSGLGTQIGESEGANSSDDRYLAAVGATTTVAAHAVGTGNPYCAIGCAISAVGNISAAVSTIGVKLKQYLRR